MELETLLPEIAIFLAIALMTDAKKSNIHCELPGQIDLNSIQISG